MSEKKKPTYDLDSFKKRCAKDDTLPITRTALTSAYSLKLGKPEIVAIIGTMHRNQFYKSMTSNLDHTQWQDVYHVPSDVGLLYVKFTGHVVTEFLLLSFKRKEDG